MKDIAIFGAGGFGKEIACLINRINIDKPTWRFVGFFDDGMPKGKQISHYGQVIGGMDELNKWHNSLDLVIAIGSPISLRGVRERIKNLNIGFPNLIAPSFNVADNKSFFIGEGNIIGTGCAVSCDVNIGDFNVLNADISIGHDVKIGNFNVIMPNIRISGDVSIGDENLLGVGSIILQKIKIGSHVHLGAGAVLVTKPKDGGTYIGNPAMAFKY